MSLVNLTLPEAMRKSVATSIYMGDPGFSGYERAGKLCTKLAYESQLEVVEKALSLSPEAMIEFLQNSKKDLLVLIAAK